MTTALTTTPDVAHGMTSEILVACDGVGHLPLYGAISSLNVATALSLAVWEVVR